MEIKEIKRGRFFLEEEGKTMRSEHQSGNFWRVLGEEATVRREEGDQCKIGDKKGSSMLLHFFHCDFVWLSSHFLGSCTLIFKIFYYLIFYLII